MRSERTCTSGPFDGWLFKSAGGDMSAAPIGSHRCASLQYIPAPQEPSEHATTVDELHPDGAMDRKTGSKNAYVKERFDFIEHSFIVRAGTIDPAACT